jgi:hypothetical protein
MTGRDALATAHRHRVADHHSVSTKKAGKHALIVTKP